MMRVAAAIACTVVVVALNPATAFVAALKARLAQRSARRDAQRRKKEAGEKLLGGPAGGAGAGDDAADWRGLAADPGGRMHLYGKGEARPGRKMGHVTRLSPRA